MKKQAKRQRIEQATHGKTRKRNDKQDKQKADSKTLLSHKSGYDQHTNPTQLQPDP